MAQLLLSASVRPLADSVICHSKQDARVGIRHSSYLPDLPKDAILVCPKCAQLDIPPLTGTWQKCDISAEPAHPYRPPMPPERKLDYALPQAVPYCTPEADIIIAFAKNYPAHTDFLPTDIMLDETPEVPEAGWFRCNITAPIKLGAYVAYKKAIEPAIGKILDGASTCAERFEKVRSTIPARITAAGKGAKTGILTGAYFGVFYAYNKMGAIGLALLPLSIPLGFILSIAACIYGAGAGIISTNPDAPKKFGKLMS